MADRKLRRTSKVINYAKCADDDSDDDFTTPSPKSPPQKICKRERKSSKASDISPQHKSKQIPGVASKSNAKQQKNGRDRVAVEERVFEKQLSKAIEDSINRPNTSNVSCEEASNNHCASVESDAKSPENGYTHPPTDCFVELEQVKLNENVKIEENGDIVHKQIVNDSVIFEDQMKSVKTKKKITDSDSDLAYDSENSTFSEKCDKPTKKRKVSEKEKKEKSESSSSEESFDLDVTKVKPKKTMPSMKIIKHVMKSPVTESIVGRNIAHCTPTPIRKWTPPALFGKSPVTNTITNTSTSGNKLRLGLSRNARFKPLHPKAKCTD